MKSIWFFRLKFTCVKGRQTDQQKILCGIRDENITEDWQHHCKAISADSPMATSLDT